MDSIWDGKALSPDAARLDGRVAIVTGAARGIGAATAVALARFGADLGLCDREEEGLRAVAREAGSLGARVVAGCFDARDGARVEEFAASVEAEFAAIDVLVNNAAGTFAAPLLEVSERGEEALIRENFGTVTRFVRAVVPRMHRGGALVHVTSIEAHRAAPGYAIYAAMKAAVENLSRSLALELAPRRIRSNCVAPDMIPTPGAPLPPDGLSPGGWALTPWPERGAPEDVAAAVVFLAGDLARFVTGATLAVDGGTSAAGGWKRMPGGGYEL